MMKNKKAQFWNLWMLVAFIIVLMLFVWYANSQAIEIDPKNAGQQSAQIFSLYQEKERITILLDQVVDQALRDGVNELANSLPGNCGISQTGKPVVQDGKDCINTEMIDTYMNIVEDRINELMREYPGTLLPKFSIIRDSSLQDSIIVYSESNALIQPPLEVIKGSNSRGFPTMITRISTIRPIPESFYELETMALAINNPELFSSQFAEMSLAITDALENPNPYCESDIFANQKFLDDIKKIIDECHFVNDNPCLCGTIMPPNSLSSNGLYYENDNIIRIRENTNPNNPGSILASSSFVEKEIMHFFPSPNEVEKLLSYSLLDENELYYYAFPRNTNVNVETQGEYNVNLEENQEGIILASSNHLTIDGKNIPFCSNLPEFSNYKVNIFVWDANQEFLNNLKQAQGPRMDLFDLFSVSSRLESNRWDLVHSNLIDAERFERPISEPGGFGRKAVNIFLLPAPSPAPNHLNRLRIGASNHFEGLPSYINGFIRMDETIYHIPERTDDVCLFDCLSQGSVISDCLYCIECPEITGTAKVLDYSLNYGMSAENPGTLDSLYGDAFKSLVNNEKPYPYLVIYYPTEVILSCSSETLDTSSQTTEIDTQAFITSIVNSVMLGMNTYFSAPVPSRDACIDYPIKELLYNPNDESYKIEDIYTTVAVPRDTDNIWPIELDRITQCYGLTPVDSGLRYFSHIGIDIQPPPPRIGWGQGIVDHFPRGYVNASFSGIIWEYGVCNYAGSENPCSEIRVKIQDITAGGYTSLTYTDSSPRNGYGEYMILKHPDHNLYAVYAHLYPGSINENGFTPFGNIDGIERGQEIGIVGNTGYSNGSHLHYELFSFNEDGSRQRYNPMCFLPMTVEKNGDNIDIKEFFPKDGDPIDREDFEAGDTIEEDIDPRIYRPTGDYYNCYVNYYDSYHNAGIKDVCPSFT